jgi:large subunit ribosomal protein L23
MALDPDQIIRRPLITEKAMGLVESDNTYCFEVHPKANKHQIKDAVEKLFSVRVVGVRTLNTRGKMRRLRVHWSKRPDWKKAVVTLDENSRIDLM